MSLAGTRSSQGDEYQLRVALHWLIRLLGDETISGIQGESLGLPGENLEVTVDDVVVLYKDGRACFIQAKKNQPEHQHWSFSDKELRGELCKARDQLEAKENSEVSFYSRSPFGELKALAEGCRNYPDFSAFALNAPHTLSGSLKQLATIMERSTEESYALARRFRFGPTFEFEDWDRLNREDLDQIIPRSGLAIPVLERYLGSHQAKLRDSRYVITRADILVELEQLGLNPTPKRSEADILETFAAASQVGRNWLRTIAGEKIRRAELSHLIELIEQGSRAVLLTDRPGSGKTCLLLDLADYIEKSTPWGLLFIKGDQFADADAESDLVEKGLPRDLAGQCARLAELRKVVVVLDSLDVLSLSRRHGALKVFLGLIDRLEKVDGVTVVVACRNFDLQYDPLLRDRKWQHRVILDPFDFEGVVVPFLRKWGVDSASLSAELRTLLQLPQNLRLFEKLARVGTGLYPLSASDLYKRFLEEVVKKDPLLSDEALSALQDMAERLMQQRTQNYPVAAFKANEAIIQRLISQEVLFETSPGILAFSHQTLADSLLVRSTLGQNKTLADFILDHPPLPFIRPTVRAFFFFLHAHQPDVFRRQVWAVLSHDKIAYHLKRLVSESLAEVTPVEDDWPLVRRLFQHHPDLFRRFFWRADDDAWFDILTRYWLPIAKTTRDRESWLLQFAGRLRVWMNRHSGKVVALWREALSSRWGDLQRLSEEIAFGLSKCEVWDTKNLRELLESLVEHIGEDSVFLGQVISRWVQMTESGDDLLWRYIVKDVTFETGSRWDLRDKLHCNPHDFHDEGLFVERLRQSDQLLTLVIESLESWSAKQSYRYKENCLRHEFLNASSWERRHSQQDTYHEDGLTVLLDDLEKALKHRARSNDTWWRSNEPHLRTSQEVTIRYLLIQAYKENIEANVIGIETQLANRDLFRYGQLEYELGELLRAAYSFISEPVQETNQSMILSLYADKNRESRELQEWDFQQIYEYLLWIPSFFRARETQAFINSWRRRFGDALPQPRIWSSGGGVEAALSARALVNLPEGILFRLLHHYNKYTGGSEETEGRLVGGRNALRSVLLEAASLHPERFLALLPRILRENLHSDYVYAFVDGVAMHLRYRFGRLRPSNEWKPVEPLPDGEELAANLLDLLERQPIVWKNKSTFSHALEACCEVLNDPQSAERLTFLLFFPLRSEDPDVGQEVEDRDVLLIDALNSTRGVAAESTMILYNNLLKKEQSLPELLFPLLCRFAHDPAKSVRVPILQWLPYLMYKQPDLGWQLLADIFQEPQTHVWAYAGQCLYYQYRNHFGKVKPYLDRLFQEGLEEAGDTWGRITTLASLVGHVDREQLFAFLKTANSKVREGSVRVFSANLGQHEHTATCHTGLLVILRHGDLTDDIIRSIEGCFGKEFNFDLIQDELAFAFIDALFTVRKPHGVYHFLEWLAFRSRQDPLSALKLTEVLADKLEQQDRSQGFLHTEPLIATLIEILREADETDDATMIRRAIQLQDRFLKMDLHGMETLLDRAARN